MEISCVYGSPLVFSFYLLLLCFLMLCFFDGNDSVVAVAVVVALIVYFDCVDFVVFAAGIDTAAASSCWVLAVVEIFVAVVVAVAVTVVVVIDSRQFGYLFLLIKNQTLLTEFHSFGLMEKINVSILSFHIVHCFLKIFR